MSEHTPRPWRDIEVDAFGDHTITQDDGGLAIAAVVTNLRKEGEVSANARLIAAAPTKRDYIDRQASAGDKQARSILDAIDV